MTFQTLKKWVLIPLVGLAIVLALSIYIFFGSFRNVYLFSMNFVEVTQFEVRKNELWMNDVINLKTYDQLVNILDENPQIDTLVEENVPGSIDDDTMIKLAYYIREKGLKTKLLSHSTIASGGVDLFLSGVKRTMERGAYIGVHSWSDGIKEAKEFPRDSEEHEANRKYIEDMLGKDDFYWFTIYAAPADNIYEMREEEIMKYGLLTDPIKSVSNERKHILPGVLQNKFERYGNGNAQTVIINTQGGPVPHLDDETMNHVFNRFITNDDYFLINVHQAHTIEPYKYLEPISFEFAQETGQKTTKILAQVVAFFKNQGKKVYVVGISFGAFILADLLEQQGPLADGYLAIAGRLDMNEAVWKSFSKGNYVGFDYKPDGSYTIRDFSAAEAGVGGSGSVSDQNMAKIASGFGYKRYTKLLKDTDLSKLVYVYGTRDEQVGVLSEHEIQFLKSKGAKVIKKENMDHSGASSHDFDTIMSLLLGIGLMV